MRRLVVTLLRGYKLMISPVLGQNCRFHPSCASYTIEAVEIHGVLRGLWLGIKRLFRCQPWNDGGYDPVPDRQSDQQPDPRHGRSFCGRHHS